MYLESYKQLNVWQKSIDLVQQIYLLTAKFPKEEIYGLTSQMRRAAVSIPSNIAEGQRRKDLPEYLQFLRVADASSAELETQIIISKRLFPELPYSEAELLLNEIQKMLGALIRALSVKRLTPSAGGGSAYGGKTQNLKPNTFCPLTPKTQNLKPSNAGIAALPTVLLIGMIVIEVAIAGAALVFLGISSNQSRINSEIALITARSGVEDALIKIVVDKDYSASCGVYAIDGAQSTFVVTEKDIPAIGQTTIRAKGTYKNYSACLKAIVGVDATTGQTEIISLDQITTSCGGCG